MVEASSRPAPNPPRYWWLKRLAIAGVVALVALIGLRLYWGHIMSARLEAAVADIEARGEPIRFDDMQRAAVPDEDNAAYFFMEALRTWPQIEPGKTITDTDWYGSYRSSDQRPPDPITDNDAYLAECAEVFALLNRAAAASKCDWGVQPVSPAINIMLNQLGNTRALARLIEDAIQRAHDTGDDRLAAELLERLLALADASEQDLPTLIGHLVGISIRAMYASIVEEILPTLRIDADAPRAATPDQLRRMITALLDDQARRDNLARAYIGERWMVYDTALAVIEGRVALNRLGGPVPTINRPLLLLASPMLERDAVFMLNLQSHTIDLCRTTDNLAMWELEMLDEQIEDLSVLAHPISRTLLPAYGAASRTHFQAQAVVRSTAIALAIKLYEHDHGHRPAMLAELVPDYLPDGVPMDPLAATPREIAYLPKGVSPSMDDVWGGDAAAREAIGQRRFAVLYSVGNNGQDNGGRCYFADDGTLIFGFSTRDRENSDEVFHLDASPKPLPQDPADEPAFDPYGPGGPYTY